MDQHQALRDRTKRYASRIIRLYAYLQQTYHFNDAALVIGKQLLRSGTGCAANHREARHSRSSGIESPSSTSFFKNWRKALYGLSCCASTRWPRQRASIN